MNENEILVLERNQLKGLVLEREQLKARIAELVNELNTLRQETGDIKTEATGDINPEATEAEAEPIESPVKEQEHPEIKSHQTESAPLVEQEQVTNDDNDDDE